MNKEWKHYASIRDLDHLEALKALFFRHSFGRHYHEGYAIGIILKGSETYQCRGKLNVAPKGSIVVVNPGEVHNGHASSLAEGWGYFMIYPKPSLIQKALCHLDMDESRMPFFKDSVIFDPDFGRLFLGFMDAFETQDSRLSLETRFLELFMILCRRHAAFPGPRPVKRADPVLVRRVMERIHQNFSDNLSLETLAHEEGLSPYALLRLFQRETGLTPYLVQTGCRIQKAKNMLNERQSFADTAAACGFVDQSHMTRQFRRWLGITPGDCCGSYDLSSG